MECPLEVLLGANPPISGLVSVVEVAEVLIAAASLPLLKSYAAPAEVLAIPFILVIVSALDVAAVPV